MTAARSWSEAGAGIVPWATRRPGPELAQEKPGAWLLALCCWLCACPDLACLGTAPGAAAQKLDVLLGQARGGDQRAFGALVLHFQQRMLRLAESRTHDPAAAADCVQEAWLSAWRALPAFVGDADDFAGWLTCIVLNACIDAGRRERRRPAEPLELAGDDGCQEEGTLQRSLADPSPSPEECAASSEAAAALESALEQLVGIHREVVELDRGGYSYREIAARTGLPIGTVRSRLSRARARLRAALAPELLWRVLGIPVR